MKTPVVLVAAALTAAILLAALVIATGTRGENGRAVIGEVRPLHKPPSLRGV